MKIKIDFDKIYSLDLQPSRESKITYYPQTIKKGFFSNKIIDEERYRGQKYNREYIENYIKQYDSSSYHCRYVWADETHTKIIVRDCVDICYGGGPCGEHLKLYFSNIDDAFKAYSEIEMNISATTKLINV